MSNRGMPNPETREGELAVRAEEIIGCGFLYEPDHREDVYSAIEQVSEYVRENSIENLILIDRAARPIHAGVREYFKQNDAQDTCPQIYFINPDGCDNSIESTESGLVIVTSDLSRIPNVEDFSRSSAERLSFEDEHPQLSERSSRPTLVMDSCTHSGETLERVMHTLKNEDFTDVRVGVVQDRDEIDTIIVGERKILPDFIVEAGKRLDACYPFGPEFHLGRQADSYLVRRLEDSPAVFRALSLMVRQEIKDIVRQYS